MRPLGLGVFAILLPMVVSARAADSPGTTELLLKVKPAVVLVMTEVSTSVRLVCPNGSAKHVMLDPTQEHGTGFMITPDGYIVTNGHVVQAYHDSNDLEIRRAAIRRGIGQACIDATSSKDRRERAMELMYPKVAPSAEVQITKTLRVVLSNRETFVAEVKAFSPPLNVKPGKQALGRAAPEQESGKDVAILKIDARNLPTIGLGDSDRVELGQQIHILGFPGVVLYHDLLDKRSAVEASVTSGRVSSLKRDTRGAPVIQTDAAASWGNSGGPAVNERGEVVGILTFISLTADETQSVQGFNFLVPANIVKEFSRSTSGLNLETPSPFNAVWHQAVAKYVRRDWAGAQPPLDAANRLVPNLADVLRLQAEVQLRLLERRPGPSPFAIGAIAAAVLAVTAVTWWGWRHRGRRREAASSAANSERLPAAGPVLTRPVPVRVSAVELAKVLEQRRDLAIMDLRAPSSYAASTVQAKGAVRAQAEEIVPTCSAWPQDREIVLYCDSPGEVMAVRAAEGLMSVGYTRVAVLAGGFAAWLSASLPLERTAHGKIATPTQMAISAPKSEARSTLHQAVGVDLSVGVKGAGPYFNARATRLGLQGTSLELPHAVTVGQRLRLTIFLQGEPVEVGGHVVSADSTSSGEHRAEAEVAFEALSEEQTVVLEGFILAQKTEPHS